MKYLITSDFCHGHSPKIIKEYRFLEIETAKFIPESYVFDKIGLKYNLLAFNEIVKIVEYREDGITKNYQDYKAKNIDGFLLKYKWNVENLARRPDIKLLAKFVIWYQYFNALDIKKKESELKIHEKFLIGLIVEKIFYLIKFLRKMV